MHFEELTRSKANIEKKIHNICIYAHVTITDMRFYVFRKNRNSIQAAILH